MISGPELSIGGGEVKIIFDVIYRVKPCVHSASGASTYGLGGSGIVG